MRLFICLGLICSFFLHPVLGEERLSEEILVQEQKAIESANLPEEQQKQAMEWLGQARQWLHQAQAAQKARQELEKKLQEAPKRLAEIRQRLIQPEDLSRDWPPLDLSRPLEWLEIQLAEEESALSKDQTELEQKERDLTELLAAATAGRQQIAELERQLAEVEAELKTISASSEMPLDQARRLSLQARRIWLQAEIERLRLRQSNLALLTELTRAERDLLALQVAVRQERTERLRQAVQSAREHQALSAANEAELAFQTAAPEVRPILEQNLSLWAELRKLIDEGKNLKERSQTIKRQLDNLQSDFDRTQQAISLAKADATIARLLRKRLESLPSVTSIHRDAEIRQVRLKSAIARRLEIEESLQQLGEINKLVKAQVESLPDDIDEGRRTIIRLQLRETFQNRREALQALQQEYTRYLSTLSELDTLEQQLTRLTKSYRDFIEQKLLWIRYGGFPHAMGELIDPLVDNVNPAALNQLRSRLFRLMASDPFPLGLVVMGFAGLLAMRRRVIQDLLEMAQATRSIRTDSFLNTLRALVDTLILAAPLPLLLFGLGWWLSRSAVGDDQIGALSHALLMSFRPAVALSILRQICRSEGLAQRHLRWLNATREQLWRHLRWFLPVTIASAFIIDISGGLSLTTASLGLGRWTFAMLMLITSALVHHLWRKEGAIMSELIASRSNWVGTYHLLWFPLGIGIPLVLALSAASGYYYAALYLAKNLARTLWYFVALMLVKDFLLRSLYVAERRLRFQEILRRREDLRTQQTQPDTSASELPPVEEPTVDFGRLSEQARRLLRIGFFFASLIGLGLIWKDAVPALAFLDQVTLPMTTTKIVGGVSKEVPLTLADVVMGLLIGLLTVLAAKNLPGLLEFTILQRLPLEKGSRYAWSSLSQYLIAAIGIYVIFSSLGVQWADIQWLIAALSVGVGFGLQEVVANFISGLLLLFERPIRVGDVVTVGNVTGTVSRIRIRATTILNWDRKELIIPNKSFITGEFINWTLTDSVNRTTIPIGIAYGSDTQKAMRLISEAAANHPEVLDDPHPLITFESFGDNALLINLRIYLGSLDNLLATISDLHQTIYTQLNAAGIEIAFPQRDVHLDTVRPLEIKIRRETKERPSP
ncbi:MAG: mechanosensitive ion channel domain-containing protein [Methylohalobius sp. ZOD2]